MLHDSIGSEDVLHSEFENPSFCDKTSEAIWDISDVDVLDVHCFMIVFFVQRQ